MVDCKRCGAATVPLFTSYVCSAECDIRPGPRYMDRSVREIQDLEPGEVVYAIWYSESVEKLVEYPGYTDVYNNAEAAFYEAEVLGLEHATIIKATIKQKRHVETFVGDFSYVRVEQEAVRSVGPQ